ncbi:MAG: threonine/serine exporter family protein [Lawsonella clevelandensis]
MLTLLAAATSSVWIVTLATGLQPLPQIGNPYQVRFGVEWWPLFVWVASFIGIAGFAVLFNCSRRMALLSSVTGATANLLKFILVDQSIVGLNLPTQTGAFIAALFIGLVARNHRSFYADSAYYDVRPQFRHHDSGCVHVPLHLLPQCR